MATGATAILSAVSNPLPWWRHAVVYQVYVRSFADSDGDGTGDIAGLSSRLPYLKDLGIDAIWVNPWYRSPLHDGGYDVADYRQIDPRFGTIDEARAFITEARSLGIRVLVDLVPNHTSWEHPWFAAAVAAGPGAPERDRYHFLEGAGESGELPPNNWVSVFGGPAWTRLPDGEWYLHMFDPSQPDLNWENSEVRQEFDDILRFWLDAGASGFRVDVAHALVKAPGYPDSEADTEHPLDPPAQSNHPLWDRPGLHEIIRRWRAILDEYPDTVMVAEAWLPDWDRLAKFVRPDEYHQTFDFHFLKSHWDRDSLRSAIETSIAATKSVGSIPTWVLSNHDVVRVVTRYSLPPGTSERHWLLDGDRELSDVDAGRRRARAAAMLMLALPGSVYLYQGEELGLPEVVDLPEELLEDPVWERSLHTDRGRDGCRVPLPWTTGGPSLGFGEGVPWLPQPEGWAGLSVEAQNGVAGSTLELYRSALRLRSEMLRADEALTWLDLGPDVLAFRRGGGEVCVVNFGTNAVEVPDGEVMLSSADLVGDLIPQDTAVWLSPTR